MEHYHQAGKSPIQVLDTLGKTVGRLPNRLCTIMSKGLREGWIKKVVCLYMGGGGDVQHDNWPQLKCV